MKVYTWFRIFNMDDFLGLDLVSKPYTLDLEGVGVSEILVVSGNEVSIVYEGVMLPLNLLGQNPFAMDGFACYLKENGDAYLGIEVDED